jgi:hypothetical protein
VYLIGIWHVVPRVQTLVDELAWWNMCVSVYEFIYHLLSLSTYRQVFGRSSGVSIASGHPNDSLVSRLTVQRKVHESENN